ncbi:MAG: flavodoxin family protein [Pseudomonadota bacterium]
MPRLLVVSHTPSENTQRIAAAVRERLADVDGLQLRWLPPLAATPADVAWCDAVAIGTTENFGSMAGRSKDWFERIYYPCRELTPGLPVVAWVRAGEDGTGSCVQLERIVKGLTWRWAQPPLVLHGAWDPDFPEQAATLAETLAEGLVAGIF